MGWPRRTESGSGRPNVDDAVLELGSLSVPKVDTKLTRRRKLTVHPI